MSRLQTVTIAILMLAMGTSAQNYAGIGMRATLYYGYVGGPIVATFGGQLGGTWTNGTPPFNAPNIAMSSAVSAYYYILRLETQSNAVRSATPGTSGVSGRLDWTIDFGQPVSVYTNSAGIPDLYMTLVAGSSQVPYSAFTLPLDYTLVGGPSSPGSLSIDAVRVQLSINGNTLHVYGEQLSAATYDAVPTQASSSIILTAQILLGQYSSSSDNRAISLTPQGASQDFPVLPTDGVSLFRNGGSASWVDPPLALGYDFEQVGGSLFTQIMSLPVGIDGDGMFEVLVGNQSLGEFAEGASVDFVQLLGTGVSSFRIAGIDPAKDATDVAAFPVQLAFDTPIADFSMTPLRWRSLGSSCTDAACGSCPTTALTPSGEALAGNANFGMSIDNAPANSVSATFASLGTASPSPIPLFCGDVLLSSPVLNLGIALLAGNAGCDGSGSLAVPLPNQPGVFGTFVTAQAITLCPSGGMGLTNAIEFPVGS
ncbi:MAG: hypothetical protein H6835_09720 [Planctomycetes bacterium]|nr:hypothetical protein [Planctomycetota bacterium]